MTINIFKLLLFCRPKLERLTYDCRILLTARGKNIQQSKGWLTGVQNMLAGSGNTQEAAGILDKYLRDEIDKVVKAGIFVDGNGLAKIVNQVD